MLSLSALLKTLESSLKTSCPESITEPITEPVTEPLVEAGAPVANDGVVAENAGGAGAVFQRVTIGREPEHPTDSIRQILRELKEMNVMNFDDEQVRVTMKEDNPRHLLVTLAPVDGLYMDGQYEMSMTLPDNYPHQRPHFHCDTPIFHPNISYEGEICFSLLDEDPFDEGGTSLRIADYAHGLLWLLYYPNLYSRLNGDCPRDEKEFATMVRTSIVGGVVAGMTYERSPRLPKIEKEKEKEKEEGAVAVECVNLQNEKNGKKWEWRLVGEDWVQVFV